VAPINGFILCLAYILGLLATGIPWRIGGTSPSGLGILALAIGAGFLVPRRWRTGPPLKIWLAAGFIGLLASVYLQIRVPQPGARDISRFLADSDASRQAQTVTVWGRVDSTPRLTRSQQAQFWLQVTQVDEVTAQSRSAQGGQSATGKLYVTTPLLQATGLHEGQPITVTGSLYSPQPALNPNGFDFRAYLAQEGGFAGLKGKKVTLRSSSKSTQWGWWAVRQRIVRSQIRWLGSPEGPLVSSMVLGGRVVDLPYEVKDEFTQIGLSHALAASGFQTSLILSAVLALTRKLSAKAKLIIGIGSLLIFVCLTGIQPAVLRAAVMGVGALLSLVTERKTKPLGSLLATAVILLIFNPLWIWNLGFQLSLLATLGLMVTVPPLMKQMDWLPPTIASVLAVPIAAYIWTLPLQLCAFGLVSPYSIVVNVLTTPLIVVISVGGVVSALVGLAYPLAGSALAWLLYYPTHLLIAIVNGFGQLPGNAFAVGRITVLQLVLLYGLIGLVWCHRWWQKRWWVAGCVALSLIILPAWQVASSLFRITILATGGEPVLVAQERGKVGLINSGTETTAGLTILPFLRQQGINHIDWAIDTQPSAKNQPGWSQILNQIPIKTLYGRSQPQPASQLAELVKARQGDYKPLAVGEAVQSGSLAFQLLNEELSIWQLQINQEIWLLLSDLKSSDQSSLVALKQLPATTQVIWWTGERLSSDLLKTLQPKVAIASARSIDTDTAEQLRQNKTQVYTVGQEGALQWTPKGGFERAVEVSPKDVSF